MPFFFVFVKNCYFIIELYLMSLILLHTFMIYCKNYDKFYNYIFIEIVLHLYALFILLYTYFLIYLNFFFFLVEMATLKRENKQTVTNILEKHEVEKLITEYEKMEAEIAAAKAEAKAKEKKEKDAKEKEQSS